MGLPILDDGQNRLGLIGSVSSGVGALTGLPAKSPRMHRRLTPIPQEEVSMVSSCMTQGLLIVENAG